MSIIGSSLTGTIAKKEEEFRLELTRFKRRKLEDYYHQLLEPEKNMFCLMYGSLTNVKDSELDMAFRQCETTLKNHVNACRCNPMYTQCTHTLSICNPGAKGCNKPYPCGAECVHNVVPKNTNHLHGFTYDGLVVYQDMVFHIKYVNNKTTLAVPTINGWQYFEPKDWLMVSKYPF